MPRTLTAIGVRRSRLALALGAGWVVALTLFAAYFLGPDVASCLGVVGLAGLVWEWLRQPRLRYLRCREEGGLRYWESSQDAHSWHGVHCRPLRVAPWVCGLSLDGRHWWLWPDACDVAEMRRLRQLLLAELQSISNGA
ncbi:protein YgfX [Salinicola sp. JS01]|uniref:protein YgfX n=1 Tax=unclassified Salinicola TaxID=2634022 RepID=UPI0033403648